MSFAPTNQELGLPENATQAERVQKIAELGGYKGLGPASSVHNAKKRAYNNASGNPD